MVVIRQKKGADVRVASMFGLTPPGWHAAVCRPVLQCLQATVQEPQRTKTAFMWCSLSPRDYFWFCVSGNEKVRWQRDSIDAKSSTAVIYTLDIYWSLRCLSFSQCYPQFSLKAYLHLLCVHFREKHKLQWSKGTVWFLQWANTDFPHWDMVSVSSKFYNDKSKAIAEATLNFNIWRFRFLIHKTSLHLEHRWGGNISSLIKHNFVWRLSPVAQWKQMLSCHVSKTTCEAEIHFILFS